MADNTVQSYGSNDQKEELDYRQVDVLSALSEDENTIYSFQGLRRKLGLHQEMLSRTLDRLEDQDLVVRTNDGYRINPNKGSCSFGYVTETVPIETQAITARLPAKVNVNIILKTWKGRWFGEFRWLGYSQTASGLVLSWITEDGRIQLRAKICNTLTIGAVYGSKTDEERAMTSAFELFDFISRVTKPKTIHSSRCIPN
jgi:DNA-binding Lrp family transcriptional regulator